MANEYLKRQPTSTGNRKVFTWSGWIKQPKYDGSSLYTLFSAYSTGYPNRSYFLIDSGGKLNAITYEGAYTLRFLSQNLFRDNSSWTHVVFSIDTTKGNGAERVSIFSNGVKLKINETTDYNEPTINYDTYVNLSSATHGIGYDIGLGGRPYVGQMSDVFFIDGQALTPEVFGFYKDGNGYISAGSTQATDFRNGQWVPRTPREIKNLINDNGGFGVNGFYLPMNDSSNFGADFHTTPNSIITLKGENLAQPRNGAPDTTDAYVGQLRSDPYASNLVLAVPGIIGAPGVAYTDFSADIKGSGTNKVVTANGNAGVAATASYYGSSMSFDGVDGSYLSVANHEDFNFGSGDFTVEFWQNANAFTDNPSAASMWDQVNNECSWLIYQNTSGLPRYYVSMDGTNGNAISINATGPTLATNQWHHIVMEREGSILRGYINGTVVGINTTLGSQSIFTPTKSLRISEWGYNNNGNLNGYVQDLRVYKGVAKYKGGFDVPKPYTPVGIGTWRAVSDTCQNNFCTLNPLFNSNSGDVTLTDGNLTYTGGSGAYALSQGTIGISTNKWYWEWHIGTPTSGTNIGMGVARTGISTAAWGSLTPETSFISGVDGGIGFYFKTPNTIYYFTGTTQTSIPYTIPACVEGDIVSIALDLDNGRIYYAVNGTWGQSGDPATGTNPVGLTLSGTYLPAISLGSGGISTAHANFGQNPTFSGNKTAGTYTDSNGKGLFKYQPPSGFLALCEDNLPTPAIKDPGEHFKTVLWRGDGNNGHSITGVGFQPDLVWIKERSSTSSHQVHDSIRGAGYILIPNSDSAQSYSQTYLYSLDSDGFTLGTSGGVNASTDDYVAWCWKAGGPAVTNSDGSIGSVVSVNQDAGFSIVSYTGDGIAGTIGHGLGKTPSFRINKNKNATSNWYVWHESLAADEFLILNQTTAITGSSSLWNNTLPTDTTISYTSTTGSFIEYVWTEIEGYSKFGIYLGNDSTDNVFVYCGFKPAMIIIKNAYSADQWHIADSSRKSSNPVNMVLRANLSNAEVPQSAGSAFDIDFLSNGFKIRGANSEIGDPAAYVFAAWAESPFQTANAK